MSEVEENKENKFAEFWGQRNTIPLEEWVNGVSQQYYEARMGLRLSSAVANCDPAELQAVLNLATLDEVELSKISASNPPITTWFQLAGGNLEEIEAALEALKLTEPGESRIDVVHRAFERVSGPSVETRVISLDSTVLDFAVKKGLGYSVYNDKQLKAIKDFARKKKSGQTFTAPQVAFLTSLLMMLTESGAVSRDSPDDDQDLCDQILDAVCD